MIRTHVVCSTTCFRLVIVVVIIHIRTFLVLLLTSVGRREEVEHMHDILQVII